ncbi:hypothetical protein KBY58_11365 [Cyanobium sp. HWJ4-Hawea]|uniref:hypothetical protein n=1 Tax=Cyanobium sp. HWJ4-Hawea TaxID=2823713 RepID=UPI0020CC909F|nr:hypothetical protein [Cyanobium sp. HWJ4-Hawea]MCP9810033.1 hypothetical protein [Cyanobium sp. HWJ4-Hawea]
MPKIYQTYISSIANLVSIGICFSFGLAMNLGNAEAQQSNNSSSLTNSAAPSASSVTTGGTNINYQTNNAYNNEMGFAPGVFCRTPALYIGGNWGQNYLDAFDPVQQSGNSTENYSITAGIVMPFGSQIIDYCKQLAYATAKDREVSSQLSMLRTCAQLVKEGLVVDPVKFPLLKPCINETTSNNISRPQIKSPASSTPMRQEPVLKPKTSRVL